MSIRLFVFNVLFLIGGISYSQEMADSSKGKMRVYTQSSAAVIYVGELKVKYGEIIELDTGQYVITAWAPKRKKVRELVRVGNKYTKTVRIKMPLTKEYKHYRNKKALYEVKKTTLRYGPMTAFIFYAANEMSVISKSNENADQFLTLANEQKSKAENSFWPSDIEANRKGFAVSKLSYENEIEKVNDGWQKIYAGLAATIVVNYFTWRLSKKLKRPNYDEKPQLTKLFIGPDMQSRTTQLTIGFNF